MRPHNDEMQARKGLRDLREAAAGDERFDAATATSLSIHWSAAFASGLVACVATAFMPYPASADANAPTSDMLRVTQHQHPADSSLDPLSTARSTAAPVPSVGPTETVSEQAEDVRSVSDGVGTPAHVVIGWGGQVTAVWFRGDPTAPEIGQGRLFVSVRDTVGTWSTPVAVTPLISRPYGDAFDVAAGRGTEVSVVWNGDNLLTGHVFESHLAATGWTSPFQLPKGVQPNVAIDGRGNTTVLWGRLVPHLFPRRVSPYVATRTPDGQWTTPHAFPITDFGHSLATNRAGDEAALVTSKRGMRAAFRARSTQAWARPVTVPSKAPDVEGAALAVDRKGRVVAAWARARVGGQVWWTHRSLAGRWSPAQKIAGNVGGIGELGSDIDLFLNRHGNGLLRWRAEVGGSFVARYRPGHGFGDPVRLSRNRPRSFRAQGSPLLTSSGTALVAGQFGSDRVAYRWQATGQTWSPVQRLGASQAVNSVGARGGRMVVLFQEQGLRARVIDIP